MASSVAHERMTKVVPRAKIVCVFRNPVDRIVSLYRLKRTHGLILWDLEKAINLELVSVVGGGRPVGGGWRFCCCNRPMWPAGSLIDAVPFGDRGPYTPMPIIMFLDDFGMFHLSVVRHNFS